MEILVQNKEKTIVTCTKFKLIMKHVTMGTQRERDDWEHIYESVVKNLLTYMIEKALIEMEDLYPQILWELEVIIWFKFY